MANDFNKLRELLSENTQWPLPYMFKFIVPNKEGKVDKVVGFLPKTGKVTFKHTKNLRHVAVTCKVMMNNVDEIIAITQKISQIEGVLSL